MEGVILRTSRADENSKFRDGKDRGIGPVMDVMESLNPYSSGAVADYGSETRAEFIRKTYWHLAGAIGLFALLETLLIQLGIGNAALMMLGASKYGWLMVMGAFMAVGWIADKWARSATSAPMQYAGLGLYVVAEALIFLPLIAMAPIVSGDPMVIGKAAVVTGALVLGLTTIAFTTKTDFSFLGSFIKLAGIVALGVIVASFFLPITLGFWFSAAMVLLAGGCVLYQTSGVIHHYQPGQHVAAALGLFASVALMFWYILRLFMRR
jgi:FtsH-binding integral membrane protein